MDELRRRMHRIAMTLVQVVVHHRAVTRRQQLFDDAASDVPRTARDQDPHRASTVRRQYGAGGAAGKPIRWNSYCASKPQRAASRTRSTAECAFSLRRLRPRWVSTVRGLIPTCFAI